MSGIESDNASDETFCSEMISDPLAITDEDIEVLSKDCSVLNENSSIKICKKPSVFKVQNLKLLSEEGENFVLHDSRHTTKLGEDQLEEGDLEISSSNHSDFIDTDTSVKINDDLDYESSSSKSQKEKNDSIGIKITQVFGNGKFSVETNSEGTLLDESYPSTSTDIRRRGTTNYTLRLNIKKTKFISDNEVVITSPYKEIKNNSNISINVIKDITSQDRGNIMSKSDKCEENIDSDTNSFSSVESSDYDYDSSDSYNPKTNTFSFDEKRKTASYKRKPSKCSQSRIDYKSQVLTGNVLKESGIFYYQKSRGKPDNENFASDKGGIKLREVPDTIWFQEWEELAKNSWSDVEIPPSVDRRFQLLNRYLGVKNVRYQTGTCEGDSVLKKEREKTRRSKIRQNTSLLAKVTGITVQNPSTLQVLKTSLAVCNYYKNRLGILKNAIEHHKKKQHLLKQRLNNAKKRVQQQNFKIG